MTRVLLLAVLLGCVSRAEATGVTLEQVCFDYARLRVSGWVYASQHDRAPLLVTEGDMLDGTCRGYLDRGDGRGERLVFTMRCRNDHCSVAR